jgi:D-lactate dehydrogenase (cytochrome)
MATVTLHALAPDDLSLSPSGVPAPLELRTDPDELGAIAQDAAALQGTGAAGLLVPTTEGQLARWLRDHPDDAVLAQGALTSLTGGATPSGDIVVSMRRMTSLAVDARGLRAVAGAGVVLAELQAALADRNLYYPPAPTHDGASIGGNVATNAAGAATFKYGTTRDWVERVRVVLRHGDVLELRRGQHSLREGDRLRIEGSRVIELCVPTYESPPLKKSSAGYFVKMPWDPIDLFIGSEGTLGFVTEVEVRVVARPAVLTGLVFLDSAAAAIELVADLRARSLATRAAAAPGLDVRSIEYFDGRCLSMLREGGKLAEHGVDVPETAVACLLFEQELGDDVTEDAIVDRLTAVHEGAVAEDAVGELMAVLVEHGVVERTELAMPSDARRRRQLAAVREAIPLSISERLRRLHDEHPDVHKVAGDMIVPFERFGVMLERYYEAFRQEGVDMAVFGHISDGNVHPNGLPRDGADMAGATRALLRLAEEAKSLGGCPLSEHGVGKHPLKKQMLAAYWGVPVIDEMRAIKRAFDPGWTLGRGVFFDP